MASHHLLRRSRAAHFGMLRALSHNVAAFLGIRGLLRHRNRFFAQSHGLSPAIQAPTYVSYHAQGIARDRRLSISGEDGRYRRFDRRSAAHDLRNQPRDIHASW
jgi:hypothetical protein